MDNQIKQMLSEMLKSAGFVQMANDVLSEDDPIRLKKYAAVVLKNAPASMKSEVFKRFNALRLV